MKKLVFIFAIALLANTLNAQNQKDEQDIKKTIQLLQKAWNSSSGETFASAFTEPHDFVVWNGYYFKQQSLQKNAETHNWIFNSIYKDTQLFYTLDKIKFLSKDIALAHVFGAVVNKKDARPKNPEVLISMVLTKEKDVWKITSFHNLDLEAFQDENTLKNSPVPVTIMYASWYADNSK